MTLLSAHPPSGRLAFAPAWEPWLAHSLLHVPCHKRTQGPGQQKAVPGVQWGPSPPHWHGLHATGWAQGAKTGASSEPTCGPHCQVAPGQGNPEHTLSCTHSPKGLRPSVLLLESLVQKSCQLSLHELQLDPEPGEGIAPSRQHVEQNGLSQLKLGSEGRHVTQTCYCHVGRPPLQRSVRSN